MGNRFNPYQFGREFKEGKFSLFYLQCHLVKDLSAKFPLIKVLVLGCWGQACVFAYL